MLYELRLSRSRGLQSIPIPRSLNCSKTLALHYCCLPLLSQIQSIVFALPLNVVCSSLWDDGPLVPRMVPRI